MPSYKIEEGSLQEAFHADRHKVQLFAGGFGNGKTSGVVIKVLGIAKDYPGANILLARATYPKLNATLRKEFFKWCPKKWIKSFNKSDNIVELSNGTTINFSYLLQQKTDDGSSSNLLSANYDLVVIDQAEDPEITEKDFLDLLGRLRGNAEYVGDDPTMPRSGPRWMLITANPTRNWLYRKLVKPLHHFRASGTPPVDMMVDKNGEPLISLFEGSTYTNSGNLPQDFIDTLEAAYTGQMRDRYLLGKWEAFEGLVYPMFDFMKHVIPHDMMEQYFRELYQTAQITLLEGYDHGLVSPSCYGFAFVDLHGNVCLLDGVYQAECSPEEMSRQIWEIRKRYGVEDMGSVNSLIYADPSLFRRNPSTSKVVGATVADMFAEYNLHLTKGNNAITNGIIKVQSYLKVDVNHKHPFNAGFELGAPHFYVSDSLTWFADEITDYYWARNTDGKYEDSPKDGNDHAMDMIKYLLSRRPKYSIEIIHPSKRPQPILQWHEREMHQSSPSSRAHRHAA